MFFYLSKILAFVLSPLVWVCMLLFCSFFTKDARRALRLRVAALLLLYLCANPFLVDECFRMWEPVTKDVDLSPARYEGAIVLGGIGDVDLRLQKITFGFGADRLFQSLPLFYKQRIGRIIFTGGSGSIEFPDKREGLYVRKYLRSIGFPDSALIIESRSRNTYENARNTRHIFDSLGLKGNYLLVTSAFHMPRALAVFKKAGFSGLTPYPTNRHSGVRRFTPDHLLVPDPGALMSLQLLIHEWTGYLVYKMKGYV